MNRVSAAAYRVALRMLVPDDLRREYGAQMEELFLDLLREARPRGRRAVLGVWIRELTQLSGIVRRLSHSGAEGGRPRSLRTGPGTLAVEARYAARRLRRQPLLTGAAVATLAVGLGLPAALYSVARASVLAPVPVPEVATVQIVTGWEDTPTWTGRTGMAARELAPLLDRVTAFSELAAFSLVGNVTATGGASATRWDVSFVSPSFFAVFGVQPFVGRAFGPEEEAAPDATRMVLSHGAWLARFGAAADIVGRTVDLAGVAYTVVGVMPAGFQGTSRRRAPDAWLPLGRAADGFGPGVLDSSTRGVFWGIGRRRAGVTAEDASGQLIEVHADVVRGLSLPPTRSVSTLGLREHLSGGSERPVSALFLGSLVILAICALNLAFLTDVRLRARERELGVRVALGASKGRLLVSGVVEASLVAALGILAALLAGQGTIALFVGHFEGILSFVEVPALTPAVAAVVAVVAAALAGAATLGPLGYRAPLGRPAGRVGASSGRRPWRQWVVAAETALAVVVLVATALTVRSLTRLQAVELGYEPQGLESVRLTLVGTRHADRPGQIRFVRSLSERLTARGARVGLMGPDMLGRSVTHRVMTPQGLDPADPDNRYPVQWISVTPGTLGALGIELVEGRDLTWSEGPDDPVATVVSEDLARRLWPGGSPVGRRYHLNQRTQADAVIVGVVRPARHIGRASRPYVMGDAYFSFRQVPTAQVSILYRSDGRAPLTFEEVRTTVSALDAGVALFDVAPMTVRLDREESGLRLASALTSVYSAIAVFLTLCTLVALIVSAVHARASELAIREALGARRPALVWLLARTTLKTMAVGLAAGSLVASVTSRHLSAYLFDLSPTDPVTYLIVLSGLTALGAMAVLVPAWRASWLAVGSTQVSRGGPAPGP